MSYFNRLKNFYITGTTSANISESMRTKKENPWKDDFIFPFGFVQRGVYFQSVNREGFQFNKDGVEQTDDSAGHIVPTIIKAVKVGNTKVVEILKDGNGRLLVRGGVIGYAGNVSWGLIQTLCAFDVASIDVAALPNGMIGISWVNSEEDNAYIGVVECDNLGEITFVNTVSVGDALDYGTSIIGFNHNVVGIAFTKSNYDSVVACYDYGFDGIGDKIGEEKYEDSAYYPKMALFNNDLVAIAYQSSTETNDPICVNKLYCDGNIIEVGIKENIATHAYAATSISCIGKGDGTVIVGWIDNSLPHLRAATSSGRELTWGDELHLSTSNAAYLTLDYLDNKRVVAAFENTSKSNYLYTTRVTLKGNEATLHGYADPGVEAESIYGTVVALNSSDILLLFADASNSNYLTEQPGTWKSNLIDVRSTSASIGFAGYILSKHPVSMGKFQYKKITGTTHATANTALANKPVLPWNNCREVVVLFKDKGCYVYNNGTTRRKSGVSLSGRTIDIRSTSTSVAFEAYVLRVANDVMAISVAQA